MCAETILTIILSVLVYATDIGFIVVPWMNQIIDFSAGSIALIIVLCLITLQAILVDIFMVSTMSLWEKSK